MRVLRSRRLAMWAALLIVFALIAAACGDDSDSSTADEPAADEPAADEPAADEMPFEGVTLQFAKAP